MNDVYHLTVAAKDFKLMVPALNEDDFRQQVKEERDQLLRASNAREAQNLGIISRAVSLRYARTILTYLRKELLDGWWDYEYMMEQEREEILYVLGNKIAKFATIRTENPLFIQTTDDLLTYWYTNDLCWKPQYTKDGRYLYLTALGQYMIFQGNDALQFLMRNLFTEGLPVYQKEGIWYCKNEGIPNTFTDFLE